MLSSTTLTQFIFLMPYLLLVGLATLAFTLAAPRQLDA